MKLLHAVFAVAHSIMSLVFGLAAIALLWIAGAKAWNALTNGLGSDETLMQIEAMGVLAAAVVALQISQTILEEEVLRNTHISGPTRVRRFLSRFLVVLVVALAVEALIATFKAQEDPTSLLYSAALVVAVGFLIAGWGCFVHLNRSAEEIEPEAMQDAKSEDQKLAK